MLFYYLILQTPAGEVAEDDGEHGKSVYVVHTCNHTGKPMKFMSMTADYNQLCPVLGAVVLFHSYPFQSAKKTVKVIHAVTDAVRLN